jgi:hypothetical protein
MMGRDPLDNALVGGGGVILAQQIIEHVAKGFGMTPVLRRACRGGCNGTATFRLTHLGTAHDAV